MNVYLAITACVAEARSHGVGYYSFSQEESLRKSQQESLNKLRQETQREQEATRDVRERRRLQMEARMKAARRRKRERMGLPPEEEVEEEKGACQRLPVVHGNVDCCQKSFRLMW